MVILHFFIIKGIFTVIRSASKLSALAKCVSIVSQYIIIQLISKRVSPCEFGLWAVMMHLAMFFSICDLGMGGGALRNKLIELQAAPYQERLQKELFFASFWVVSALSFLILPFCFFFSSFGIQTLFPELPDSMSHILLKIFFVFISMVLLRLPFNLHASGFYAYHEAHLRSWIEMIEAFILSLSIYSVFAFQGNLCWCILIYYIGQVVISCIGFFLFLKRRGWGFSLGSWKMVSALFKAHLMFWLQNIVSLILFSLMPLCVSAIGGVVVAGEYFLLYRITTVFIGIHFAILNPLWSEYSHAFFHGHLLEIKEKHQRHLRLTLVSFVIAAACLAVFYKPVIFLWTGKSIECTSVVISLGIWMIFYGVINCLSILLNSIGSITKQLIFLSLGAACNLLLGAFFGRVYGTVGIVIAAIIALLPLLFSNIMEVRIALRKGSIA